MSSEGRLFPGSISTSRYTYVLFWSNFNVCAHTHWPPFCSAEVPWFTVLSPATLARLTALSVTWGSRQGDTDMKAGCIRTDLAWGWLGTPLKASAVGVIPTVGACPTLAWLPLITRDLSLRSKPSFHCFVMLWWYISSYYTYYIHIICIYFTCVCNIYNICIYLYFIQLHICVYYMCICI